jgi:uracil-DNA glycosylase
MLEHLNESWRRVLAGEFEQGYFRDLESFVESEYRLKEGVYPPKNLIFNALNSTPYENVKVVILGQDPYHGPGQAHGLAFSVNEGVPPPPSLKNIYKELESDLGPIHRKNGCLIHWAKQGVLLLNATLTVCEGKPLSHHKKG